MEFIVSLCSVTKRYRYGERNVVDDLDLNVNTGEFLSVTGPSGAGKSTLLNLIAGLDEPTEGRVLFEGNDLARLADHHRADLRLQKIGFIFQSFHLIPSLTVTENVGLPLRFAGFRSAEIRRRTEEVLEQVGIPNTARRRHPSELSGGEQQRVAIARAFSTRPRLLLADEPTGNLDSDTGARVLDLLRDRCTRKQMTIVMVTHSEAAASYSSRAIHLVDGRIASDDCVAASSFSGSHGV